jgi:hypothetical protein
MDLIDDHRNQAEQALAQLGAQVQNVSKGKKEEQLKQIAQCDRLAHRVKLNLDSYRLEQSRLTDPHQKDAHGSRLKELEDELKQCRTRIDWKRFDVAAPVDGSGGGATSADGANGGGLLSTEQAVKIADDVQNASLESLARTKRQVLETENVGINTLGKMHEQGEQMKSITAANEDIKANLKRSKKLLGQIMRNARQDWCIRVMCIMMTIAIVVMIILAGMGQDGGSLNVPDEVRNNDRNR